MSIPVGTACKMTLVMKSSVLHRSDSQLPYTIPEYWEDQRTSRSRCDFYIAGRRGTRQATTQLRWRLRFRRYREAVPAENLSPQCAVDAKAEHVLSREPVLL